METYRYGGVWRAIGITGVVLAMAFPALMVANRESFDAATIAILIAFGIGGAWAYAHFERYRVTITPAGFTVDRFLRVPFSVQWRDVLAIDRTETGDFVFRTSDRRKIVIPTEFPGALPLEAAAARNVPHAFDTDGPPLIEPEPRTPQERRLQLEANRRYWLRMSGRSLGVAVVLVLAGWIARSIQERIDFQEMPRAVAVVLRIILGSVEGVGLVMAALAAVLSIAALVMGAQESIRLRRITLS